MKPRTYPVPVGARTALLGSAATADRLDLAATLGNEWAHGVISRENRRMLVQVLDGDTRLPFGVTDGDPDEMIITGLVRDDLAWTASGWAPTDVVGDDLVLLNDDEVAFVARGLLEGASCIALRSYTPVAFIAATEPATGTSTGTSSTTSTASTDLPEGAKILAVVDDLDRNAVLEVVAVTPGPTVWRRHDGTWQKDPAWVNILRSVKPPPVVQLDEAQVASVLPQVDEATKGAPFLKEPPGKKPVTAAAYVDRADEMAIEFALLASKVESKARPSGATPAVLKRYWTTGPGGAKIRWGTPGAWRRCHRHLSKYVGPFRAKGQCTNLGQLMGGKGVAWDVG